VVRGHGPACKPAFRNSAALTGIERANFQFSSVQLGLSQCKYVQLVRRDLAETCHRALACQRGHSRVGSESGSDAPNCTGPARGAVPYQLPHYAVAWATVSVTALWRRLKLPKGASLHTVRHTHGSFLLADGVDLATVPERLGHSSVRVTADIYSHALRGRD
jgi:integrase